MAEEAAPTPPAGPPPEVLLDEQIDIEDLGAEEASILPDSPWHGLKRFWWGVEEVFTFDPVADAALKFDHANQELAELHQLIERDGIAEVDMDIIEESGDRFQERMERVTDTAEELGGIEGQDRDEVDAFLTDMLQVELKQQKLLDSVVRDTLETKEEIKTEREAMAPDENTDASVVMPRPQDERVAGQLDAALSFCQRMKKDALQEMGETLLTIDGSSDAAGERLSDVLADEEGSYFIDLKHLEMLENMAEDAPRSVQAAVALAKQKTKAHFEARMKELPAASRADRLSEYVEHASGDETKIFTLLDEVKKTGDLPLDILERLEEIKEIVAQKFAEKLALIDDASVEAEWLEDVTQADDVSDVLMFEEFGDFVDDGSPEAQQIEDWHAQMAAAFIERFSDATSQEQAALFQDLSAQLLESPSPKVFKLLRELEEEVRSDPEKSAFLDQMEQEMQQKMETQFRYEGEKYAERLMSFDVDDLAIYDIIDFDATFKDTVVKAQVDLFRERVLSVIDTEDFDKMYKDFSEASSDVIEKIKAIDPEFQNDFLLKQRKIEEQRIREEQERQIAFASLDYEEREFTHQVDRLERQEQEEFWEKLNEIPWEDFEARKALWEENIAASAERAEEKFAEQKRLFEERLALDPFGCDEVCQEIHLLSLEQEFRHQQERLSDDLLYERNRIEREGEDFVENNPLFGKCDFTDTTGKSCETYCQEHVGERGCEWFVVEQKCVPPQYWDYAQGACVESSFQVCAQGQYWDPGTKTCVIDPYWQRPQCPYGYHWVDTVGFCEKDTPDSNECAVRYDPAGFLIPLPPHCYETSCPPGQYWDAGRQECAYSNQQHCGLGMYFDYVLQRCEQDPSSRCGDEEYWDYGRGMCVSITAPPVECLMYTDVLPCPAGQFREPRMDVNGCWTPGECQTVQVECPKQPLPCPAGSYRSTAVRPDGCTEYSSCIADNQTCPAVTAPKCPAGQWVEYTKDAQGCPVAGACKGNPPIGAACGNNICEAGEATICPVCTTSPCPASPCTAGSCPGDCREVGTQCSPTQANGQTSTRSCSYSACPNGCSFDTSGCPIGCAVAQEWCGDNVCSGSETSASCSKDCSGTPQTTVWHTWYFKDGGSVGSNILGRTDAEYLNFIAGVDAQCRTISGFTRWMPGGGNQSVWQEFGIPDCSGAAVQVCDSDRVCDSGETRESCPSDCGGVAICDSNGVCDAGEDYTRCPADCQYPGDANSCPGFAYSKWDAQGTRYCQLNTETRCEYFYPQYLDQISYTAAECPKDDGEVKPDVCGDGGCGSSESSLSCPADCGPPPPTPGTCAADSWRCPNKTECETNKHVWCDGGCYPFGSKCETTTYCGDKTCNSNESSASCPADCGAPPSVCDGDKMCESGETATSCPSDCGSTGGTCDNDRVCESNETYGTCPGDCPYTATSCPSTEYNNNTTGYACNYTKCPNGCSSDSNGCPNGCSSASGMCSGMSGWHYESNTNSCVKDGVTCSNPTVCSSCQSGTSGSWCQYDNNGCPSSCQTNTWDSGGCGSYSNKSTCEAKTNCYWHEGSGSSYCYYQSYVCDYDGSCESSESAPQCGDCKSTSCSDNGYNSGSGSMTCNYTACPNGCQYNSQGCPTSCYTSGAGSCPNNGYNTGGGSTACNYTTCPNGCQSDSQGCPTSCYTTGSGGGSTACNSNGTCESGESTGSCPSDCGSGGSGYTASCDTTPSYCTDQAACTARGYSWCNGLCYGSASACTSGVRGVLGERIEAEDDGGVSPYLPITIGIIGTLVVILFGLGLFFAL